MMRRLMIISGMLLGAAVLSGQVRPAQNAAGPVRPQSEAAGETPLIQIQSPGGMLTEKPVSAGRAFFYSFVLPGAGQYYSGSGKGACIFLGSEIAVWSAYALARMLGNWRKEDAVAWAASRAGIDLAGRDHAYFIAVENYADITAYNNAKLQQRDIGALYPEDENHSWQWESDAARKKFEKLRVNSDAWFDRSTFIIAGVILNHLISGIDAVRAAKKSANISVGISGIPEGGLMLTAVRAF